MASYLALTFLRQAPPVQLFSSALVPEAPLCADEGAQLLADVSAVHLNRGTGRALKIAGQVTLLGPLPTSLYFFILFLFLSLTMLWITAGLRRLGLGFSAPGTGRAHLPLEESQRISARPRRRAEELWLPQVLKAQARSARTTLLWHGKRRIE